ncbi:hypothetical protein AB0L53_49910 [Nonomuraea sp. NPDC052129]|uniref:hypothetical protein n=1 Tax=Nonomuraea sp. NPDC052129 TaxID=3154651 RepID=UPI003447AB38
MVGPAGDVLAALIEAADWFKLLPRRMRRAAGRADPPRCAGRPCAVYGVRLELGHASPLTTQPDNHGTKKLDAHAAYRMAARLGGGSSERPR